MYSKMTLLFMCSFVFSILLAHSMVEGDESLIVSLPDGKIQGRTVLTHKNVTFYAFQQVPFAEPPIGKLRFQPPQPIKSWSGVLDCTKNERICYQTQSESSLESEDCLTLNVYTPVLPGTDSSLTVMVYIYGGGFIGGSATFNSLGPHHFINHNIIIVTINYRVGPFGFLSTNDEVLPGNMGLKDQNLALKWVQKNIALFGGDPEKVTIFGESSGGASVSHQVLSPKSAGLFRAAISQSGTALSSGAYQRNAPKIARQLATFINPQFNQSATSEELFEFFQSQDADVIDEAQNNFKEQIGSERKLHGFWFAPVIEPDHADAFISSGMYDIMANGSFNRVPLIIGICSEEYIERATDLNSFKDYVKAYEADLQLLVSDDFHINNKTQKALLGEKIRSMYTSGLLIDDLAGSIRYFSDAGYGRPIIRTAQLQSQYTDVYFYKFSYSGISHHSSGYIEGADRVGHAEDLSYQWVWNGNDNLDKVPEPDVTTTNRYVKLFVDFAKTLNPTPEKSELMDNIIWPKMQFDNLQYLNINDTLEIQVNPRGAPYPGWIELFEKEAIKPLDTY